MECNVPTDITFSFTGFALRGGKTGPHADGWGVALYEGKFARSFLEPKPACESAMANFIRDNPIKTLLAVAHVRKKTRGKASLENTHPFKRVLWGRHWVFAHNGTLPHVKTRKLRVEEPLGETDSEHAFCWMLERIRDAFPGGYPKDRAAALAAGGGRSAASSAPRGSSTSCSPTGATSTRAAGPSSATSSARRRSGAPRCATPRWRSIFRRSPPSGIGWRSSRPSRSRATRSGSGGRRDRSGCSGAAPCARRCPAGQPIAIRCGSARVRNRWSRRRRAPPEVHCVHGRANVEGSARV